MDQINLFEIIGRQQVELINLHQQIQRLQQEIEQLKNKQPKNKEEKDK